MVTCCVSKWKNKKLNFRLGKWLSKGTNLRNRFKQMTEVFSLEKSSKNTALIKISPRQWGLCSKKRLKQKLLIYWFVHQRVLLTWQSCKGWKQAITLTIIVGFPAIPFSCFNARNLVWLAAWHTITTLELYENHSIEAILVVKCVAYEENEQLTNF